MHPGKLLLLLATGAVLLLSSCTKAFTCECCGGISGDCHDEDVTSKNLISARKACNDLSTPDNWSDGYECKLKLK